MLFGPREWPSPVRPGQVGKGRVMDSVEVRIETADRLVTDLTAVAQRFCADRGDGLLNVFAPHATAGVALMEVGSGSEADLAELLGRLLPRDERYRHRHGSAGHGADHVLPTIISPSITVPVLGGRAELGTWQSLVMIDTNADNPSRLVRLSFIAG